MNIGKVCNRNVIHIGKQRRVLEAAHIMRDAHAGDLVVVEERGGRLVPVGVLTDRDIVVGLLAKDVDHIRQLDVGDLLTRPIVTATDTEDLSEVLARMQEHGVRRMPIVDKRGELVGIFTVDDLLGMLSADLSAIVSLIGRERRGEVARRP